jgi:hypothetical protein
MKGTELKCLLLSKGITHKRFCPENLKGRYHSEDLGVVVGKYQNVS